MKKVKFLFLFAFMAILVFPSKAQGVTNISETSFFKTKFTKEKVWDAQRFPAYPVTGQNWTLRGLKNALEANGTPMAWATGRYLMFFAEVDNAKGVNSLVDDINNNGAKYNISLKLFESDGTLVKVVSKWGRLIGIGEKGFMYEAEGKYGIFFSVADLTANSVISYKPTLAKPVKLSEIAISPANSVAKPQGVNNVNESSLFKTKFVKEKVWDAQRFPAYPVIGQDWKLSGLKNALEANGTPIAWATGRYLMFFAEVDNAYGVNSLVDDINNDGTKYNISLKLFESNGTLVKVVSKWGSIIGIGDKGFMYEAEGRYGAFFSIADLTLTSVIMYKPSLAKASKLSEITKDTENGVVVNQNPVTDQSNSQSLPLVKYAFKINIDDMDFIFQEVSGLSSETQVIEYRGGDSKVYSTIKMPGIQKFSNVTLQKGILKGGKNSWEKFSNLAMNTLNRSTITISLMDEAGNVTMSWILKNAFPVKIAIADKTTDGNEIAIESLEIAHEGLVVK